MSKSFNMTSDVPLRGVKFAAALLRSWCGGPVCVCPKATQTCSSNDCWPSPLCRPRPLNRAWRRSLGYHPGASAACSSARLMDLSVAANLQSNQEHEPRDPTVQVCHTQKTFKVACSACLSPKRGGWAKECIEEMRWVKDVTVPGIIVGTVQAVD